MFSQAMTDLLKAFEKRTFHLITRTPTVIWLVLFMLFLVFMYRFLENNYLKTGFEKILISPTYHNTIEPILLDTKYIELQLGNKNYDVFEGLKDAIEIDGFSLFATVEKVESGKRKLLKQTGEPPDPKLDRSYVKSVRTTFENVEANMTIYPNALVLGLKKNARNQALKPIAFIFILMLPLIMIRLILYRYVESWLRPLLIDGMNAFVANEPGALDFEAQLQKTRRGQPLSFIYWKSFLKLEETILETGIELKKTRDKLKISFAEKERIKNENIRQSELRNMADQVAHDIKKPLLVLETIQEEMMKGSLDRGTLTELLRESRRRIKVLINTYSQKSREGLAFDPEEGKGEHMVWVLLAKQVYQEKRVFSKEIRIHLPPVHWNAWVNVNADGFKNLISNLINNARDALGESGDIELSIGVTGDQVTVTVQDNGIGMPPEFLPKAMNRGEKLKKTGSGLGLTQARDFMQGCSGSIRLESTEGKGTTVHLTLPKQATPSWSLQHLTIFKASTVVVLDDQDMNHQAWTQRFAEISPNSDQFEEEFFYDIDQFEAWLEGQQKNQNLFLVDYMLKGDQNGLDVIRNHRLEGHAILVTSISDDAQIRQSCEKMKVPLMPKELIPHIQIRLESSETG